MMYNLLLDGWCNFNCNYCVPGKFHEVNIEKVLHNASRVVNYFNPNDAIRFEVQNGEITLFDKYMTYAMHIAKSRKYCHVELLSNGNNLQKWREEIIESGIGVCVSLDGHTEELNLFRQGIQGKIGQLLSLIVELSNTNFVGIQCVITDNNKDHLNEYVKKLEQLGFQGLLTFSPVKTPASKKPMLTVPFEVKITKSKILPPQKYIHHLESMLLGKPRSLPCEAHKNWAVFNIFEDNVSAEICDCCSPSIRFSKEYDLTNLAGLFEEMEQRKNTSLDDPRCRWCYSNLECVGWKLKKITKKKGSFCEN